ncbi:single-stranded DNA-binding protein [Spirochaeta cellobiosiphila]|uniref:single-stranded DNA-binding protein n=1 Tax=Spirochaeta cellobiosiphila TaxID=504483 RepID=UPI00040CC8E6|nr:single-stranded DNA-binding protein [Spirochaeta cellobiosiphila]
MQPFNSVVVEGNLVKDPETRTTPNGHKLSLFTVAHNYYYKVDGEQTKGVNYFDIEVWNRTSEFAEEYLSKGTNVRIAGILRQDRWNDKDGHVRSKIKIIGEHIEFRTLRTDKKVTNQSEFEVTF